MRSWPYRIPPFLRTMLLLMLIVGTAVRPALVMVCELQSALGGEAAALQLDAADAADPAHGHGDVHAHGSHNILQDVAPDSLAAILPLFEMPVVYRPPVHLPDMNSSAPPRQPAAQPFRPPIA